MKNVRKVCRPEYLGFILVYLVLLGLNRVGVINAYYFQVITIAGINVVMTISLNMVIGITGQFSMGHAGFMSIGAYISAIVSRLAFQAFERTALTGNLVLLVAIICGGIVAAFFWIYYCHADA